MPLHKHKPVPEIDMVVESPVYSICETQRIIYKQARRLPPSPERDEIMLRARIGVAQGKAMSARLVELDELESVLPAVHPRVSREERAAVIAGRRPVSTASTNS